MKVSSDYDCDVFVSYKRGGDADEWLHRHFLPLFERKLRRERGDVEIFVDANIHPGEVWEETLRERLATSRVLMPVLDAEYFGSTYCLAELDTMQRRDEVLDGQGSRPARGVIYPLHFADGKLFSAAVERLQLCDVRDWNYTAAAFADSADFLDFERVVERIAQDVGAMLDDAPPFDASWPRLELQSPPPPRPNTMTNPRFGGSP